MMKKKRNGRVSASFFNFLNPQSPLELLFPGQQMYTNMFACTAYAHLPSVDELRVIKEARRRTNLFA